MRQVSKASSDSKRHLVLVSIFLMLQRTRRICRQANRRVRHAEYRLPQGCIIHVARMEFHPLESEQIQTLPSSETASTTFHLVLKYAKQD